MIMNTAAMSFTPTQNHQIEFPISLIDKISSIPVLVELGVQSPLGGVALIGFQHCLHLLDIDLIAGEELLQDADEVSQVPRLQQLGLLHPGGASAPFWRMRAGGGETLLQARTGQSRLEPYTQDPEALGDKVSQGYHNPQCPWRGGSRVGGTDWCPDQDQS